MKRLILALFALLLAPPAVLHAAETQAKQDARLRRDEKAREAFRSRGDGGRYRT